jgi:hypothetical protein
MRSVFIFATLLAVAFSTSCYYGSTSEDFYDLSKVGSDNWITGTDNNNNVWNINVCVEIEEVSEEKFMKRDNFKRAEIPTCPMNSSVCVQKDEVLFNMGTDSTAIFSDSPNGASSGVEVIYSAEGDCTTQDGNAASIKTIVEYNCAYNEEETVSIVTDGCFTTINVNSPYACPQNYNWDDDNTVYIHTPFFAFFGLVLMAVACTCLCCCCCMRRKRIQKRNIAMRQFSNVAFQPIPASQMKSTVQQPQTVQQNLPAYNPYVQPQFLYYYPSQQQQVQQTPIQFQQPQMVELEQMNDDEKLAKQLQAQFDRESQV